MTARIQNSTNEKGLLAVQSKTTNYVAVASDFDSCLVFTGAGGYALTLLAPSSAYNGYTLSIVNQTTGIITITPASGNINGNSSYILNTLCSCQITCNGSNYFLTSSTSIIKEVEVDFGSTAVSSAIFTVTDPDIVAGSKIMISISGNAPSDSRKIEEIMLERYTAYGVPASGSMSVYMAPTQGTTTGKTKILYTVG